MSADGEADRDAGRAPGEEESEKGVAKPGQIVGERFRLVELLGEGGMGEVWRATQLNLGRDVALKLMHPEYSARREARARFEREAKVASAVHHPNVVQIYDFGDDDGALFLSMELLEGQPLRALVEPHLPPLALDRALHIVSQVADALAAAHELGLVHRDLKPENIFLERSHLDRVAGGQGSSKGGERVVVVDFGLAFIRGDAQRGRVTRQGAILGTPDYISPEQVTGSEVGPASDVYSLGCVLFELLTSRPPFVGTSNRVVFQHMMEAPPSPRELCRSRVIPSDIDELCLRMLAKLPEERPTMAEVYAALTHHDDRPDRSRKGGDLEARTARMISAPSADDLKPTNRLPSVPPVGSRVADGAGPKVAVLGEAKKELLFGIGTMGLAPTAVDAAAELEGAEAILALDASLEALAELRAAHPIPLITAAEDKDMTRLAELVKLGVDEVLPPSANATEIANKLWRAIRRHRRRRTR